MVTGKGRGHNMIPGNGINISGACKHIIHEMYFVLNNPPIPTEPVENKAVILLNLIFSDFGTADRSSSTFIHLLNVKFTIVL